MSKRPPFVKVATVGEVPEGTARHIVVHDKPITLGDTRLPPMKCVWRARTSWWAG